MADKIDWDEIQRRYEATKPFRETPGETTWVDRLYTWEEFRDRGHQVARMLKECSQTMLDYDEMVVALNPALHDLLMEVYG
jgi:hypothetical protein